MHAALGVGGLDGMENLPKIVRERLKVASIVGDHPDADMLTAFAERSLVEAERGPVLEHLVRCGECRDIVALALPAIEATEAPVSLERSKWLRWPALRWGFAVAGLTIIASLGIARFQHRRRAMMAYEGAPPAATEARNQTLPDVGAPEVPVQQSKKLVPVVSGRTSYRERAERDELGPAAPAAIVPQSATGSASGQAALPQGPKRVYQANEFQRQNANAVSGNIAVVPPPPMARQTGNQLVANARIASSAAAEGQPSSAAANPQSQNQSQNPDLQSAANAEQSANYGEEKVGRAKEPTNATVAHSEAEKALAGASAAANSELMSSSPTALWAITSAGGLQRSLDQGHSWQDVNVKASATPAAGSGFDAEASATAAKVKDATDNAFIVLRAVAANGAEVWAGGSAAQLYHSMDAGTHWSKVVPSAGGAVLTGDVVSLEFVDAQHGRVSTSTSEVWITGDDGATWQKQ